MTIAVLALQGAFAEHEKMIRSLGADCIELRQAEDLKKHYDGLILPGGESTVQGKLLRELGMFDTIKKQIEGGLPVLATCAGMIHLWTNCWAARFIFWHTAGPRQKKRLRKTISKFSCKSRCRRHRCCPDDLYPRTICCRNG
mgnify:CR=1 FL=1